MTDLRSSEPRYDKLVKALEAMATEDFRGNEPRSRSMARELLPLARQLIAQHKVCHDLRDTLREENERLKELVERRSSVREIADLQSRLSAAEGALAYEREEYHKLMLSRDAMQAERDALREENERLKEETARLREITYQTRDLQTRLSAAEEENEWLKDDARVARTFDQSLINDLQTRLSAAEEAYEETKDDCDELREANERLNWELSHGQNHYEEGK